jgi:hypothetical protein
MSLGLAGLLARMYHLGVIIASKNESKIDSNIDSSFCM